MVNRNELFRQVQALRPLPASTIRLAAVAGSPEASIEDICEIIAYDQALTLALLRAANTAVHATTHGVTRVYEAVFRLGAARVLALAVSTCVKDLFHQTTPTDGLDEGALWKHSVAAAAVAETLADFVTVAIPPETFSAALLHDFGKLIISRYAQAEDLQAIYQKPQVDPTATLAAEQAVLGMHHAELGGLMARHWQLPERIVQGITFHHHPAEGNDLICDVVYVANQIAKQVEQKPSVTGMDAEVLHRLGLTEPRLNNLITAAQDQYHIVCARYNAA